MRTNKYLTFLLIPFCLIGCKRDDSYKGDKITLDYVEEGHLVESNVPEMKVNAFDNKVDSIYYIGDDSCAACADFKPKLVTWCAQNHANIYYIKFTEMTQEESSMLTDLTVGSIYEWGEKNTLPTTFFMMRGTLVFRGESSNTVSYLKKYVTVKSNSESVA